MAELCDSQTAHTCFVQYLTVYCSQLEADSDVITDVFVGPIVLDKRVKFGDPRTNCAREIPTEAVGGGIFDGFCAMTSNWKQIVMSYQVWPQSSLVWMSMQNLVILGQTGLEIYDSLTL